MTIVRLKGFQIFIDRHGRRRCYHRASRTPIDLEQFPIGTAAFFGECQRVSELHKAAAQPRPGTLRMLIKLYRAHDAFTSLSARTRADYQKVFDYLDPIGDTPLVKFTPPLVVAIRDKANDGGRRRRFATYVKQTLSTLFSWGVERGHLASNPALRVKGIKKPRNAPQANRPWEDDEREAVLAALPAHMLLPIGLMMFCAIDPGDVVALPKTVIQNGNLDTARGKTGEPVWQPLPEPVQDILARSPSHDAITLCANSDGRPWARGASGLRASWAPIRKRLEREGKVRPGLTLKGLRHSVATILREMGKDERTIADYLGQKTPAMARHYSQRADLRRKNAATVADLTAELAKRRTKLSNPT